MKRGFWYGFSALLLAGWYPAGPVQAQSLTGVWQGVETDTGEQDAVWPAVLRLQKGKGTDVFGVLYQEVGGMPAISVTFQMEGAPSADGLRLRHVRKLNETGRTPFSYWCDGAITFTYDAKLEKLSGHATYRPVGDCDVGTFTMYRIKLKSPATVKAGTESTIRVSGRNVMWYADPELKQPLNTGNTYRTRLNKTTTFYLTQGFYPTSQSPVVPITIQATGAVAKATPKPAPPPPPPVLRPDTARPAPAPIIITPTPVVLPTVLFKVGTPELLPEGRPALDQLAAELKARPTLRIRVVGHTDRVGEHEKNQLLSEQRAAAVKDYLVQAGVAADRISTIGYGDTRPLFTSPNVRNRRVEVEEVK
ncbi:OmpA family protein [Hymenobacter sp. BT770]|uniref:OmpA family protein n=1 Tax=Hymenobacter sp. BT770 TaxID=2886942 RepID=UPI001D120858|nr:OmpA family protein [Hymenobacter sp. BT770]MCC3152528.1 OmpA family protein [Hymenobacter sp. BT770]MDO3414495.1 OmpA family protein [Hymenobacter sp. BT770]